MFEWLSNVLNNIATFFSTVWDFIINLFKEIWYIIQLLTSVVTNMPGYLSWLPSSIALLIITAMSIVVIYKITGRT